MNFVSRFLRRSIICRFAHDLRYVSIAAASTSASSASNLMFSSKPRETPEGDVLDDLDLALMGDFVGVKSSPSTIENKTPKDPEISVAKLQEEICKNRYLKAHNFITSILQPLERKIEPFCAIVRNSPSFYASILIEMCGEVMTDIPTQNRMIILNRLVKSMTGVGMKMSIDVLNSMVQVWLQNYHSFDVRGLLNFTEKRLNLEPNSTFFTLCAWQLARQGDSEALSWLKGEMARREIVEESDIALATIFCEERRGNFERDKMLKVLAMAESICCKKGIEAVVAFVHNYRKKFVVHSHVSNSVQFRNTVKCLFLSAFRSLDKLEWKDLEQCKIISGLCDLLMEQQLIGTRESFVDAGVEFFLEQSMFSEAFVFWRTQVRVYHSKYGMQHLLDYIIARYEEHEGVCKDRIVEVMRESSQLIHPMSFIASLVMSMVSSGYLEDAKAFIKLFSVGGSDFIYSLGKIAEKEDLQLIEHFGELLQDVYFTELRTRKPNQKTKKVGIPAETAISEENKCLDIATIPTVSSLCKFEFLLNIWKKPFGTKRKKFMRKPTQLRLHKVDVRELEKLAQKFVWTWAISADKNNNCSSLIRLHEFVSANEIRIKSPLIWICRKVFLRNGKSRDCPFGDVPAACDGPRIDESSSYFL